MLFRSGRPLVKLNEAQLDREANFRSELIHVREYAEPLMITRRELLVRHRLLHRVDEWAENLRRIIRVNRKLGLFTTGYNYLIQILPALIVAPLFIARRVEFGRIDDRRSIGSFLDFAAIRESSGFGAANKH